MPVRSKSLTIALAVAILIETICATYLLRLPQYSIVTSIIYFASGIAISFLLLFLPQLEFQKKNDLSQKYFSWLMVILVPLAAWYCFYFTRYWISTTPMRIEYADMLPLIKVMNERLLSGHPEQVYTPVQEIWGGTDPAYFPALWLPYGIGVLADFDLRWINSFALFSSFVICLWIVRKTKSVFSFLVFMLFFLLLLTWLYQEPVHNYIRLTEEGVVVLYYMLFFLAIISGRKVLIGITLALCLLSRFSIIGWVPAITVYFLLQKKFKDLLIIGGSCVIVVLLLFILPFGWSTALHAMHQTHVYRRNIPLVWQNNPEYFTNFLGFSRFYVPHHLQGLHNSLLESSFLLPLFFILFAHFKKVKLRLNNILLATGKLSLVAFYSFIYVPYLYLFYTSSMVSLLIAAVIARTVDRSKNE